eukprot:11616413-Karenia_brevis.AAC.1
MADYAWNLIDLADDDNASVFDALIALPASNIRKYSFRKPTMLKSCLKRLSTIMASRAPSTC